jgi:hypothetical protein
LLSFAFQNVITHTSSVVVRSIAFDDSISMHDRTAKLHDLLISSMACWSCLLLLVVLPLYIAGANYYECGDALVKTTSAFLADALEIEAVVVALLAVVALSSIVFAAHFRVTITSKHVKQRRRQRADVEEKDQQHDDCIDNYAAMSNSLGLSINNDVCPDNAALAGTAKHHHHPFLLLMLWVASLVLLSFPSFVYGLTTAVPTEDSIWPWFAVIADIIHGVAPIIITLINSLVVPAVVVYCCDRSKWQSARLLLVSRLVTTWLVPVAVVVLFSNACGRWWLLLWSKCNNPDQLTVWGPSGNTTPVLGSTCLIIQGTRYQNIFINNISLVSGSDICDPSKSNGRQPYAQCGRVVVEAMAPLLVGKMALAALVLPALAIFRWRVAPAGWKDYARGMLRSMSSSEVRARLRTLTSTDTTVSLIQAEDCENDGRSASDENALRIKGLRLDNMVAQSLTWLDVAIVFGPHIPLLVPLVLISLVTNRWAHESVGLRRLGLKERRAEFSKPSTWYVLFSIVCQQALTVAVFVGIGDSSGDDSTVGGGTEGQMALMMVVVSALTTIACVAVAGVPLPWLGEVGRRCGGCCVRCHQCCCRIGVERSERRAMMSTTELSNRSLLGGDDEGEAGSYDGVDEREAESKTPTVCAGAAGSTLETPLLQG